jgi:hypothetical protein
LLIGGAQEEVGCVSGCSVKHCTTAAVAVVVLLVPTIWAEEPAPTTFCNPLDLEYPFVKSGIPRRGGSEPVVVLFDDEYYLFASNAQGYWRSTDLRDWTHVSTAGVLPTPGDSPGVVVHEGAVYWLASSGDSAVVFRSVDPRSGRWEKLNTLPGGWDPTFLVDTDGNLYLYRRPVGAQSIVGIQLQANAGLTPADRAFSCRIEYDEANGWEGFSRTPVTSGEQPWLTPASMQRYRGTYYLQYSVPGCDYPEWADGCYRARSPRGPFVYDLHSPVCRKLGGFATGVGSGETFRDRHGNLWRATSMVVSGGAKRVRRICLFPAEFDPHGVLHTETALGDYPMFLPRGLRKPGEPLRAAWMLLSHFKPTRASSFADRHFPVSAVDENAETYWSVATGASTSGAWLTIDLEQQAEVHAVQLNFAEDQLVAPKTDTRGHCYALYHSLDGQDWKVMIDRRKNDQDRPHEYVTLTEPVRTRHLKLVIESMPQGRKPAVRDLRVFGISSNPPPAPLDVFHVFRDVNDERQATIVWKEVSRVTGYLVRYGIARDKLYQHVHVTGGDSLRIRSLNRGVDYYFRIDTLNDGGLTEGNTVVAARFRQVDQQRESLAYE